MTQQFKNKIRAIVLLMVFSLNTVAGFACSVGVDMGYNTNHHKRIKPDHGKIHHDHANSHLHKRFSGNNLKAITDDCCSGQVNSFQKLDKSLSYNNLLLQAAVSILNTPAAFFFLTTIEYRLAGNSRFGFVRRSCSFDDTDIRIAIQSFQI